MADDSWQLAKDLLSHALKHSPEHRAAALDEACGDNRSLRAEVEALLKSREEMGDFLEEPIFGEAAEQEVDEGVPVELQEWDRYRIVERLGRGGMAVVYKALDPRLNRTVAIKLISGRDDLMVKRFLREAEAQARVDHDNVLEVYETGMVGRHHYIAMHFVDGPTLLGVRDETTLEHKVELMLKITEGLHAAHRQGLVHRDIKPGNILVERSVEGLKPYLLDFGLAVELGTPALTKTGVVVGTPRYMAPERIQGGAAALDRRVDIYGLGAAFHEFISGATPFAGSSGLQVLVDVMESEFKPLRSLVPTISPELDAVVMKCLEKDPQRRYSSARALADELRRYLDGETVLARPAGIVSRLVRKARRHPRLATAFLTLASLTLVIAGWGAYGYWHARRQAELSHYLGQEIRDLEWLMRASQLSPLHPIDAEKQQVRGRMSRVEQLMSEVGSIGFGPGHYALGRGFLILGDHPKALGHLQQAWDSGYRTADAAGALGLAHGQIFRAELTKAQRLASTREREARIKELESSHRERALYFLGEGRSSTIVPIRFVDALISSHRGDREGAIAKAEEAARETPWLFEARLLQGHLEFEEAVKSYTGGDIRTAAEKAGRANDRYAEAQRIAESSVDPRLGRCAVSGLLLHMGLHGFPADVAAAYKQAEESCSSALIVEPGSGEAFRLYSEAVRIWGSIKVKDNENPGDAYDRSASMAQRAMEISGADLEALLTLADTLLDRAWWESRSGKDPRPSVDQAVATYEKALTVDPRNEDGFNNMGQAWVLRSRYELSHRLDASDSQNRAVANFQRAVRLNSDLAPGYRNLSRAAIERADELSRRGLDPSTGLEELLRFIDQLPGNQAHPERFAAVTKLRARIKIR